MNFTETLAMKQLAKRKVFLSDTTILSLFNENPERFKEFSESIGDIIFDFSKNLIDTDTLNDLVKLAGQIGLKERIEDMFAGKTLNFTEGRAVLHAALRDDSLPEVVDTRRKLFDFARKIRTGDLRGHTKARFMDVVNIGIGGSYLGPMMAVEALAPYRDPLLNFHFISNIDPSDMRCVLGRVNPETTLFIVASKTFTTDETMTNAASCKEWLIAALGKSAVAEHFCAISTAPKLCADFGILAERIFPFGDYVGGRYSMWGPIGLPILISIGVEGFEKFLSGARMVDNHLKTAGFRNNIPVLMGLLSLWNGNFLGARTHAVLPYDHYLRFMPSYLQQLVMESNGKSVGSDGEAVDYPTSPIVFGDEGTNGQHSFYQLLHQGTDKVTCDFILPILSHNEEGEHQLKLLANGIAQSEALMRGRPLADILAAGVSPKIAPYKAFEGGRPSNTFLVRRITPETLGALIALYEHKTFVEGVLWDINSFDQMGVELGKVLATQVLSDLKDQNGGTPHDSSTAHLIGLVKGIRTEG